MTNMDRNICRTMVPVIIGAVVAYVVKMWMKMPPNDLAILTPLATTIYYGIVRGLEERFPRAGWFLGCLPMKATDESNTKTAVPVSTATKKKKTPSA